ncbi:MAG: translation initiation factor IF-1 [Candidatus Woykebacteria bacterium RBG_13_40_7b]|uniref:Translation initiation factor IF-1 n=1 Tax=Candidatus Woykebacteria bacterium RBG_13_40_7b TaxID=1802594 RepID=A0A1G1W7W3_9BACT|nr:MAG: translation initiation factor IF-1 [Candidatus Woykebacteria bacterium RBG_13_40_7b]
MEKEGFVEFDGKVVEILPNTLFRVEVAERKILCYLSGKMRMHYIKITPGDKVKIQVSAYDPDRGRIIYRY